MILLGIILLIVGLIWLRPLAYVGGVLILMGVLFFLVSHGTYAYY